MSDMSQGPGWWIASDGKWYPPHLHPSVRIPAPGEAPTGWSSDPGPANPRSGSVPSVSPDDQGTGAGPARRPSRRPLAAVAGLVVVILLVVGAVTVFGTTTSASARVIDAVTNALNNGTAHMTVTLSGTTDGTSVTGTGSGTADFTNNAAQMQLTVEALGHKEALTAIDVGGVVYESIPGLGVLAPGKSWISIDLSALQKEETQDPGSEGLSNNPSVMLQTLDQQGNTVVPLGPSTIDGVAVTGYSVTVDPAKIEQKLKEADLPAWMQQALAGFKVHDLALKVYVDQSGDLRAYETQTTESTAAAGTISLNESVDLSDYGAPVNVNAPPASQVESFQQFLQTEGTPIQ
jgi:hypothetical protein